MKTVLTLPLGKKKGLLRDIRKFRNEFFAHNSSFSVDENDIKYCLDRLSTLLSQPIFRNDKKCKEMYKRVFTLKDSSRRVQYNDITDTRSILQPFIMLYHNEPMIVVEKANELISNIKSKPLTRPLHRRFDLILLVLLLCYHFIEIPRSTNNGFKSEKGNSTVEA